MKILRIVYDWPEPWDGLAPAPYFLSRSQGLLGHEVTVLTGGLNGKSLKAFKFTDRPEKNVFVIKLVRALSKHTGPFFTTSPLSLLVYLGKRLFRQVDVVHGHGHIMLWFNIYKYIFGKIDRVPYVAHFHICAKKRKLLAIERGEKFTVAQKIIENPLHELSDWLAVRVADKCITVSESNKQDFIECYKAEESKIIVVESAVPTNIFYDLPNKQLSFNSEIIGVGSITRRKGIHLLIESLKYLPSKYILRWVGSSSDEEYRNELADLAKNLDVSNRVIFEGYVPNMDMPPYFRNALLFVLPSTYEGFPKVVLEALACGVPCLVSGFEAKEKIDGLSYLHSLAPKSIALDIKKTLELNPKVDVSKIKKKYSWDAKAKEIDNIYSIILGK